MRTARRYIRILQFLEQPSQCPFRSWVKCCILPLHLSVNKFVEGIPVLIKVNFKNAACLGELNRERFVAFVKGKNTLLRPAAACCLVGSVSGVRSWMFMARTHRRHQSSPAHLFLNVIGKDDAQRTRSRQDDFVKGKVCRDTASKVDPPRNERVPTFRSTRRSQYLPLAKHPTP